MEKFLQRASETSYVEERRQPFMKKDRCDDALYAEPLNEVSPTGKKLTGNVVVNATI